MPSCEFPASNRTWQILRAAKLGQYAVGAYNCYNNDGVMAVIRAAENKRSPAIIQLFPWTLRFQGPHFVRYVVEAAHAATVPISVHLDHCIDSKEFDAALDLPFDSIMVDASTADEVGNLAICTRNVERARRAGITIEVEMGRIEGGEDGLPKVDMEQILTDPAEAASFMKRTGAHFLAPSFGNIHGRYPCGGAEKSWNLKLLRNISAALPGDVSLALHGTHPVSDDLFQTAIKCGVSKINVNRTVRDEYTAFVAKEAGRLELTELKVQAVEVYTRSIERIMDVFGSSGRV